MRFFRALDSWWLDIKLGIRMLAKHPGLTLVGGFGIAVGVAIAAGGYSVTYGSFLVSSLPLEEGDRIVAIEIWDSAAGKPEPRILYDFHVWREKLKSVQEISAFRTVTPNLIAPGAQPGSIIAASMSASGFRVARVQPLMGRYLVEDDEREGAPFVLVIGESVWRNRFAGDPGIVGRTVQLGSTPHTIVGVMPENFAFPVNHRYWVPLREGSAPAEPRTGPDLMVFGRLAPGAALENAQAEVAAIGRSTALAFPKTYAELRPQAMPYTRPLLGLHQTEDVTGLHAMQVLVALLLVVVCLNIAVLVYARTAMRQAEIAIRNAVGASRTRIVCQLFIEAFVLSAAAAVAGIVIAALGIGQIAIALGQIAFELPFWMSLTLSTEAVLYAGALSVLAAAVIGIVPALKATRRDVHTDLRIIGAGVSGMQLGKMWTSLIVAQVAFAVALLPAAVSSAWESMRSGFADIGYPAEEFLSAQIGMRNAASTDELIRRLKAEPRVSGLTFAAANPGEEPGTRIETQDTSVETLVRPARFNRVDVDFFRTFNVPVLAGRGFVSTDIEGEAVVVNRSFAEEVFGGNALGRRIRYAGTADGHWYEIVGIVADFPTGASPGMDDSKLKLYHAAAAGRMQAVTLAIRLRGGTPSTFSGRLREIAAAVDADLQLRNIVSLDEAMRREQWIRRMEAAVFGGVTLSVLMLSAAGIYSLMSMTVSQRRKEIGIRTALGADRKRIVVGIFSRALAQLGVGAALGMGLAALLEWGGNIMRGNAPVVVPLVALFMMLMGFLAAIGPVRRGLQIEPTEALREQ